LTLPTYLEQLQKLGPGHIAIGGVPFDAYSSFMRGPALAPPLIVDAYHSDSANYYTESLQLLDAHPDLVWLGDIPIGAYEDIDEQAERILHRGPKLLALGGDHSITYPLIKATAKRHSGLTILHLDAHTDMYDSFEGNRYSHACPFARILENGLVKRLVQVGVRTMIPEHRDMADKYGVEIIEMKDWRGQTDFLLEEPLYVSLDLDVLEPGLAPGLSHYEPGGMTVREVLSIIQAINVPVVGADIVEYNPLRDREGLTAMIAAKCMKELLDKML
jgi:arginase